MQFQADLLGIPVARPKVIERPRRWEPPTWQACPAAFMPASTNSRRTGGRNGFHPTLSPDRANELMQRWEHAVAQTVL